MGAIMPKGTQLRPPPQREARGLTPSSSCCRSSSPTPGCKTQIGLLNSAELWVHDTALIIAVACLGQVRRLDAGGARVRARLARGGGHRHPHEHARADGAGHPQHRPRAGRHHRRGVRDDGDHGAGHDRADHADAQLGLPRAAVRRRDAERRGGRRRDARSRVLIPVADPTSGGPLLQLAPTARRTPDAERRDLSPCTCAARSSARRTAPAWTSADAGAEDADAASRCWRTRRASRHRRRADLVRQPRRRRRHRRPSRRARHVDLVLMGFHRPVFGRTILGGTVHRVLTSAPSRRRRSSSTAASPAPKRILVPYLGGAHDRLALELADRIGASAAARGDRAARRRRRARHGEAATLGAKAEVDAGVRRARRSRRRCEFQRRRGRLAGRRGAARGGGVRPGGHRRGRGMGPGVAPVRLPPAADRARVPDVAADRPQARRARDAPTPRRRRRAASAEHADAARSAAR